MCVCVANVQKADLNLERRIHDGAEKFHAHVHQTAKDDTYKWKQTNKKVLIVLSHVGILSF